MYEKTYTFNKTCNVDRNGADTFKIAAYTLSNCMAACAGLNAAWGMGACTALVFRSNTTGYPLNCFLRNGTLTKTNGVRGITSAELQGVV